MTEQVFGVGVGGGGVDLSGGCVAIFGSVFQSYYIFVQVFFSIHHAFFGSILPIFAYFCAVYYVYFIKKSNNFPDVRSDP